MAAGVLKDRFKFQRNTASPDWTGQPSAPDWRDQFTVWAGIRFMRGGEAVIAARLTARQPAVLRIRNSAQARGILPSVRAVNTRTGEFFIIREMQRVARDNRGFLEALIVAGASD